MCFLKENATSYAKKEIGSPYDFPRALFYAIGGRYGFLLFNSLMSEPCVGILI